MTAERDLKSSFHASFQIGAVCCLVAFFGWFAIMVISVTYFPSSRQIAFEAVEANDLDRLQSVISMVDMDATQMGSNIHDELTLLSTAVVDSSSTVVLLLLDYGADPNHQGAYDDWTPLHRIAFYHLENPDATEIIKLLIDKGADPTITDVYGKTPIDYARDGPENITAALQWKPERNAE